MIRRGVRVAKHVESIVRLEDDVDRMVVVVVVVGFGVVSVRVELVVGSRFVCRRRCVSRCLA